MSEQKTNPTVDTCLPPKIAREKSPNILVVDDDPVLLNLFDKVLKKLGLRVVGCNNSQDALNLVRKTSPDVVLLDIKMPGMDGITALKEIKALDPDIEVVIMTGYASLDSALEAIKYGAFDYIRKPFDQLDQVVHAILRAWERRKPHTEGRNLKISQERNIFELKVLYNTSRTMGHCSNYREIMEQLLDSLNKIVDYDLAMVILAEKPDQKKLILQMVNPSSFSLVEEAKRNLVDAFNLISRLRISPQMDFDHIIGEEKIKPESQDVGKIAKDLNSFLNVPMMKEGKLLGMINVSSHRDRSFSPDDIRLIYTVVSQVPSAMQKLEEIKAAEKSRMEKLGQSMTEGAIVVDENFEVMLVNPVAQNILGSTNLTLVPIQNALGIDLRKLRTRMEREQIDLIKQEVKINSDNYEVSTSMIKGITEGFMGFVISFKRSGKG